MLFKLESKPKHSNCPRCQSTDTFLLYITILGTVLTVTINMIGQMKFV